ncbi:hypothetical protein RND71_015944 [Anisodus tanguticus]|uniref:Uncharacterized protein n=1 Tax=Anisodus tanguticus TaxID=243964 RepID=A0AAE1VI65_9SOLA|nr:hypothetical protein RND71_015944 [Anisodus tanguticus]
MTGINQTASDSAAAAQGNPSAFPTAQGTPNAFATWDCLERRGTLRLGSGPGKKEKNLLAECEQHFLSL